MADPIKKRLKGNAGYKHHSKIIDSLKKQKRSIDPNRDTHKTILYQLKQDYKKEKEPVLDVNEIKEGYDVMVNDHSIQNPFIVSSGLVQIIKSHTRRFQKTEDKAFAIYNWIEKNIQYGTSKRTSGYKNTKEVLLDKEGVCGEMAFLYITMARCCGLRSALVEVDIDCFDKYVEHACAIVDIGHKDVLVDPAYHTYDILHKKYQVLTDSQVLERFNQWRTSQPKFFRILANKKYKE